jgi:hypothetical protein
MSRIGTSGAPIVRVVPIARAKAAKFLRDIVLVRRLL